MKYLLKSSALAETTTDCLVVGVWTKKKLSPQAAELDEVSGQQLSRVMNSGDIDGKIGQALFMHEVKGVTAKRVLMVGCGDEKDLDAKNYRKIVDAAAKALNKSKSRNAFVTLAQLNIKDRDPAWSVTQLVREFDSHLYQYDQTKSKKKEPRTLKTVNIAQHKETGKKQLEAGLEAGKAIATGVALARHLGNLPGNVCTPSYLGAEANKLATRYEQIKTQVLSEKQMQKLGMGSLLSVSAGSAEEAKLIVISYEGTTRTGSKAAGKPHVLVGKGITFDTGGISLKPSPTMDEMKFDMCGAASVIGTMASVAELKLPINVIGVVPAVENMPGSRATKPGDIVTSMSGQTIEVLNTDAEGRLVLCDALTYIERFKPKSVIDIATLTGAAVATFGEYTSALLSNNEALADKLIEYGQDSLDPVWQLPLWDEYQSLLDSNFADIANIGGPRAGTITAACFLSRFTKKYHWAHLDIAGTAWHSGAKKGATGRPVPLLVEYLRRQRA